MVSQIKFDVKRDICIILDVNRPLGGDFRDLASRLHMSRPQIDFISQKTNPTDEILKWWGPSKSATVKNFREILLKMGRDDAVAILDEYHTGTNTFAYIVLKFVLRTSLV